MPSKPKNVNRKHEKKTVFTAQAPAMVTPDVINALVPEDDSYDSPVDLSFDMMKQVSMPKMDWYNMHVEPKLMKITNSGGTAIISGKWFGPRPYVCSGPLSGFYVFAQLHFHWGEDDELGSEHTIDGKHMPLEMHAMFFKKDYITQEAAVKKKDGIIVFAYFFKVQEEDNEPLNPIVNTLKYIVQPYTSEHMEVMPLTSLVCPFDEDYFLYWGNVLHNGCHHPILWIISRHSYTISSAQLQHFRTLKNFKNEPLRNNFRPTKCLNNRAMFHVNPSSERSGLLRLTSKERAAILAETALLRPKKKGSGGRKRKIGVHYVLSDGYVHMGKMPLDEFYEMTKTSSDSIDEIQSTQSSNMLEEFTEEAPYGNMLEEFTEEAPYGNILDQLSKVVEECDAGDSTSLDRLQARLEDALQRIESKKSLVHGNVDPQTDMGEQQNCGDSMTVFANEEEFPVEPVQHAHILTEPPTVDLTKPQKSSEERNLEKNFEGLDEDSDADKETHQSQLCGVEEAGLVERPKSLETVPKLVDTGVEEITPTSEEPDESPQDVVDVEEAARDDIEEGDVKTKSVNEIISEIVRKISAKSLTTDETKEERPVTLPTAEEPKEEEKDPPKSVLSHVNKEVLDMLERHLEARVVRAAAEARVLGVAPERPHTSALGGAKSLPSTERKVPVTRVPPFSAPSRSSQSRPTPPVRHVIMSKPVSPKKPMWRY